MIAERIGSVGQLEVLLLLHRGSQRAWTAAETAAELRVDRVWAETQLNELARGGLLVPAEGGGHRYGPASPDLDRAVGELSRTYTQRRVAVIHAILSNPSETLRTFAHAFRLRKDKAADKDIGDG